MSLLEHLAKRVPSAFKRGVVYWCYHLGSTLAPRVSTFLDDVAQGFAVPVAGFDQVVRDFCDRVRIGQDEFRSVRRADLTDTKPGNVTASLNVAMVKALPDRLYRFRTGLKSRKELEAFRDEHSWWQATVHDGSLWLLGSPGELPNALQEQISTTPEPIDINREALLDEDVWRIFSEIANKGLATTLQREHGLRHFRGNRFFFAKPSSKDERKIKYMCRKRRAFRRVVWLEFERGTEDSKTRYYCHEALRPTIARFYGDAALVVSPTKLFTVFGDDVWDSETARISVGRSKGKVWNEAYDSLVRMWLDVLSKEGDSIIVRFSADGRQPEYRLQFSNRPLVANHVER